VLYKSLIVLYCIVLLCFEICEWKYKHTDDHRDRQTYTLIAVLCTHTRGQVKISRVCNHLHFVEFYLQHDNFALNFYDDDVATSRTLWISQREHLPIRHKISSCQSWTGRLFCAVF